jgi:hypothetical protein
VRNLPLIDRLVVTGGVIAVGVLIGVLTTLHHLSIPPWGVVVALVVLLAWGVGLRLITPGRGATLAGLLAALGAQFVLAAGSQTSIIVSASLMGYVFTLGGVVIALVVLAWPDMSVQASSLD